MVELRAAEHRAQKLHILENDGALTLGPVLFEFRNAQYLSTGSYIGKCRNIGKNYKD